MKISQGLRQFIAGKGLLVTTGLYEAVFYLAAGGVVEKVHYFHVPKPHYSDREDFTLGGGALIFESGAKFESIRLWRQHNFLRQFKEDLLVYSKQLKIVEIYLFIPRAVVKKIITTLPQPIRPRVKAVYVGNWHRQHPFVLLKKIRPPFSV